MSVDATAGAPMPEAVAGSPEGGLRNRMLTIVAQDPGVRYRRRIVTGALYQPAELPAGEATAPSDARILGIVPDHLTFMNNTLASGMSSAQAACR